MFLDEELFLRKSRFRIALSIGTIPRAARGVHGAEQLREEVQMQVRPLNLPSDTSIVDVRLGLTVTGLYTLVGMGIVLAFM
ncbi:hypothetical protein UP10_14125 [Bradyrhizobium sp. LTSPM299]|uniref:hypothetical protein n=1 Tax=Bradyrhizobium sp. LTSPM299 TaxID=1619233 RepID=UPI0005CB5C2C|nr:hypothetical protein [Bradyrhizobium sp. LTSPM299]KJC60206.1 hypothetical protein UP10_14125 [Bradyrhizobium sp. LTSPM299]